VSWPARTYDHKTNDEGARVTALASFPNDAAAPDAASKLAELLAGDVAAVDAIIHDRLASQAAVIPAIGEHLVNAGGKRLRPMLTLAAAKMFGASGHDGAQKLSAAVEFIHTATLLHDDVVDESKKRRGQATANVVWGNATSVLVGDFLFSRAFELMVEAGDLTILDLLARTAAIISEGEVMQLGTQRQLDTARETHFAVIEAKTAALFSAAGKSGAMAAGASQSAAEALAVYGKELGVAYQLVDDALDYSGREARLGKSVGDDFREGKMTLPVILAYEGADGQADRDFWVRTIGEGIYEDGDFQKALDLMAGCKAVETSLREAEKRVSRALSALEETPAGDVRTVLRELASFTLERSQ
jgi:octaprenyl-diphosphate synthase